MNSSTSWLTDWRPEDAAFWRETGRRVAFETLAITTASLTLSFATWFLMSAVVVRLPQIGFKFSTVELFWLGAMPGLAGGTLRIIHTFLIPIFGARHVITVATLLKILPCVGLGLAVMNPGTPFWVFIALALALGLGGGDFSSFMPSTSLFFPRRLQGTALGIQAGIGNFGVSLAQFVVPWIIGFAIYDAVLGGPQVYERTGRPAAAIWVQNAAFAWIPLLVLIGVIAWSRLRSVPIRASFGEQLDIFGDKHTWFCTITYVMTFGAFSGLSAAFPLMIRALYGGFPNAPDPLAYAFLGPLVGSVIRIVMGWPCDRWGGSIFTLVSGVGLIVGSLALILGGYLTPTSLNQFPVFVTLMLLLFFFAGAGNAATFRQYPIIFAHSPRQGAGVLGFSAAIAAYGPFIFSGLIGTAIDVSGSTTPFFWGAIAFWVFASVINFWYYTRPGKERWDFGSCWGTWWDASKDSMAGSRGVVATDEAAPMRGAHQKGAPLGRG